MTSLLVTAFMAVTVLIPSYLTLQGLGAAGSPATIVGVVALAWWILSRLGSGHSYSRGRQPIRIGVYLFVGTIILSYAAAFSREITAIEASGANRGMLEMFGLAGIALLTADGIKDRQALDALARRLVFWMTILGLIGLYQFVTKSSLDNFFNLLPGFRRGIEPSLAYRGGFVRIEGTADSPIEFGVVLAACLPLAVHFAMQAPRAKRVWRWIVVAIFALAIPLSLSRGGIVGLAIAFVVMFIGWRARQRIAAVVVAVLSAVALHAVVPRLLGTVEGYFKNAGQDSSVIHRQQDLQRSEYLLRSSLWFGRGIGTFIPQEVTPANQPLYSLDNQYLGSLIETGVVGLTGVILLMLIGFCSALGVRRRSTDASTRELALALAASSLVIAFGFYVLDVFSFTIVSGVMFVLLGLTGALWRISMDEQSQAVLLPVRSEPVTV
jgi:O-antigen ligase